MDTKAIFSELDIPCVMKFPVYNKYSCPHETVQNKALIVIYNDSSIHFEESNEMLYSTRTCSNGTKYCYEGDGTYEITEYLSNIVCISISFIVKEMVNDVKTCYDIEVNRMAEIKNIDPYGTSESV
jgi:hypothetical protein